MLILFMHFIILLFKWEDKSPFNFCQILYYHFVIYQKKGNTDELESLICNLMNIYTEKYKKKTAFWLVFKCTHFQSAWALILSLHSSNTLNFHTQKA